MIHGLWFTADAKKALRANEFRFANLPDQFLNLEFEMWYYMKSLEFY